MTMEEVVISELRRQGYVVCDPEWAQTLQGVLFTKEPPAKKEAVPKKKRKRGVERGSVRGSKLGVKRGPYKKKPKTEPLTKPEKTRPPKSPTAGAPDFDEKLASIEAKRAAFVKKFINGEGEDE